MARSNSARARRPIGPRGIVSLRRPAIVIIYDEVPPARMKGNVIIVVMGQPVIVMFSLGLYGSALNEQHVITPPSTDGLHRPKPRARLSRPRGR
jgi:hypothetical protein